MPQEYAADAPVVVAKEATSTETRTMNCKNFFVDIIELLFKIIILKMNLTLKKFPKQTTARPPRFAGRIPEGVNKRRLLWEMHWVLM
jgi:hypothetical protein